MLKKLKNVENNHNRTKLLKKVGLKTKLFLYNLEF